MTLTFALILMVQDTPAQLIEKAAVAVEKKDLKALSDLLGKTISEEDLKEADENAGGKFAEALKKGPKIGDPGEKVTKLAVRWAYGAADTIRVEILLEKKDGKWKLRDFEADLRKDDKPEGASGKTKTTAGEVLGGFVGALEKKEWAKALEFAPKKVRDEYSAEKLEAEFGKVEKELKGHFLEALKLLPAAKEGGDDLTGLQIGIAYDSSDGEIEADVEFTKEDGAWVIADFDVDFNK